MASIKKSGDSASDSRTGKGAQAAPAWADGLKQLYDSVVDEPLPDSFMDLLAQFDDTDTSQNSPGRGGDA